MRGLGGLKVKLSGGFYKNVFYTLLGSGLAQVLPALITPFLALLFTPVHFSLLANLTAMVFIVGKTLSGSYYQTIILAEDHHKGRNVLALQSLIGLALSLMVALSGLVFNIRYFDFAVIYPYCAIGIFFFVVSISLENWHIRHDRFRAVALSRIIRAASTSALSFGLFYLHRGWLALAWALLAGFILQVVYLLVVYYRFDSDKPEIVTWRGIRDQAVRFREYAFYNTFAYLFNNGTAYAPIYFIGSYFGSLDLGKFYFATRLVQAPINLVSDAYSSVLIKRLTVVPRASVLSEMGRHLKLFLVISAAVAALYIGLGEIVLAPFLTKEWADVFPLLDIIVAFSLVQMILTNYCLPYKVYEWNRAYLVWEFIRFALVLGVSLIAKDGIIEYLRYYALALSLSYLVLPAGLTYLRKKHVAIGA